MPHSLYSSLMSEQFFLSNYELSHNTVYMAVFSISRHTSCGLIGYVHSSYIASKFVSREELNKNIKHNWRTNVTGGQEILWFMALCRLRGLF